MTWARSEMSSLSPARGRVAAGGDLVDQRLRLDDHAVAEHALAAGAHDPDGTRWVTSLPPPMTRVWPALAPPP
jgi:hypothetical protein